MLPSECHSGIRWTFLGYGRRMIPISRCSEWWTSSIKSGSHCYQLYFRDVLFMICWVVRVDSFLTIICWLLPNWISPYIRCRGGHWPNQITILQHKHDCSEMQAQSKHLKAHTMINSSSQASTKGGLRWLRALPHVWQACSWCTLGNDLGPCSHFTPATVEPPHERQEVPHHWRQPSTEIRRSRGRDRAEDDSFSGPGGGHHRIPRVSGGNPLVVPMAWILGHVITPPLKMPLVW